MTDPWDTQMAAVGAFIRSQRRMANLSLRQLAGMTNLSNAYLSQIERGVHKPSVRVLKLVSEALNVSAETLLAQAGLLDDGDGDAGAALPVVLSIRADHLLSEEQKTAMIAVYHSMLRS